MQRPPAGGDQTPRQTDARCPNAPTFTGRDCHLQSSRNVVTLIRRAHAASAVPLHPSVTRIPHCVPSSLLDRSHSTDLWQLIIVTTVHPLSRFNPGAPGVRQCPWVGRTSRASARESPESPSTPQIRGGVKRAPMHPVMYSLLPVLLRGKLDDCTARSGCGRNSSTLGESCASRVAQ